MSRRNDYITNQLRDDEEVLLSIRRSPIIYLWSWAVSCFCIIASFFFMFPLLRQGTWGLLVFFLLLTAGAFLLFRAIRLLRLNILVLTNQRIIDIDQQALFHRVVSETVYDAIQELSFTIHGVLGTAFHIGTLVIHTAGSRADIAVSGIKDPHKLQDVISKIKNGIEERKANKNMTASELVDLLDRIRAEISPETKNSAKVVLRKNHVED